MQSRSLQPMPFTAGRYQQGGTLAGLLIGLMLGLGVAAGAAYYVFQKELPFISDRPTEKPQASELVMVPEAPVVEQQRPEGAALPDPNQGGTRQQVMPQLDRQQPGVQSGAVSTVDVAPEARPAAPVASGFQLQAGSFRRANEAEALKLRLALTGLEARVESARVNGQPVYRVRVGPYSSLEAANQVLDQLADEGIEAAVIRPR